MIRDILDIMNPRQRFTASARYYPEPVNGPEMGAQHFNYEYVDPYSNTYRRLFGNIQGGAGELTIRTDDQLKYCIDGIVVTQDGKTFKIAQVEKDFQAAPKQALRLLGTPLGVEYVLRLISIPNPWNVQ